MKMFSKFFSKMFLKIMPIATDENIYHLLDNDRSICFYRNYKILYFLFVIDGAKSVSNIVFHRSNSYSPKICFQKGTKTRRKSNFT